VHGSGASRRRWIGWAVLALVILGVLLGGARPAEAPAGPGPHRGSFDGTNEPSRIGWREVVVVARGDARLLESSAPAADASDELRRYPAELLQVGLPAVRRALIGEGEEDVVRAADAVVHRHLSAATATILGDFYEARRLAVEEAD